MSQVTLKSLIDIKSKKNNNKKGWGTFIYCKGHLFIEKNNLILNKYNFLFTLSFSILSLSTFKTSVKM